jgi:hypothetical protein
VFDGFWRQSILKISNPWDFMSILEKTSKFEKSTIGGKMGQYFKNAWPIEQRFFRDM